MAEESKSQHRLKYRGFLKGHGGWVTSLAVGEEEVNGQREEFLLSGSRDRTLIKWQLEAKREEDEDRQWGAPRKMMTGHSHFISEIKLTGDSRFAFSASWDGTVRLWNVATGRTISKLIGHKKDVLSVALSSDDRQIITGSLDKDIKIWNTRSECKFTVDKNNHTDAVSVVRFYHAKKPALCVTASWDKTIKVWDIVNGKWFTKQDCDSPVNAVLFSQKLYWLVIATQTGIKVLNLPEQKFVQEEIRATSMKQNESDSTKDLSCTSMAWSKNGQILYTGWTDNHIRVYEIDSNEAGAAE